jgi:arginine decarboxylase
MAQPVVEGSVLLLNGFKDHEFLRMAFHASELGHQVIVVLESVHEVRRFIEVSAEESWAEIPQLGMRAKLYSRGSGRWQSSGGEASKFGLTTGEILRVLDYLNEAGLRDQMSLLQFNIGSQVTQIKRIKMAAREAVRLYSGLQQGRCPSLQFLDLGGGIGVDYDGSRSSYPSSVNYSLEEYANQVVFEVAEVIAETGARPPTILTESGRVLVATHAVTVADVREVQGEPPEVPAAREDEHRLVEALRYTLANVSRKNYEEYFHDAVDFRDEVLKLFSAGVLDIEDRAAAEALFKSIRRATSRIVQTVPKPSEEIEEFLDRAQHKYLVNFSIFQSIPDAWSVGHVFPVAPLSRHGDRSEVIQTSVVDITCDSDGCVTDFAHPDENLKELPLHRVRDGEPYYLGFFMTGAYQDSLANEHNLFGRCHEVVVRPGEDELGLRGGERFEMDGYTVEVKTGDTNETVLGRMDFDVENLLHQLRDRHLDVDTTLGKPWALGLLQSYPYLSRST